jgi:hypothetical protein
MPKKQHTPGDFDIAVRRARAGLGLFTNQPIAKGSCVIEYTGVPLTLEEVDRSNSRYLFEIDDDRTIDGAPRWNRARYINHSCRPNCEIEIDLRRGRVFILARRNIKPGEELSYDYGKDYFRQYINGGCRCLKCKPDLAAAGIKSDIVRPKVSAKAAAKATKKKR